MKHWLLGIIRNNTKVSDYVEITVVNAVHSYSYDPSYVDQYIMSRTRYGEYKRFGDKFLRNIMVQMAIDPFVNVRVTTELL